MIRFKSLLLSLWWLSSWTTVNASPGIPFWRPNPTSHASSKQPFSSGEMHTYYPWENFDEEQTPWIEKIVPAVQSIVLTCYGSMLLLYSKNYPGQIHLITMLRATGFDKIEKAVLKIHQNFRDAIWSAVWNSPSFFRFKRNYRSLNKRMDGVKVILAETKKAKADGVVTAYEASRIKHLRKQEIGRYQKEMKGMVKTASSLKQIFTALDFNEIKDVCKGFLFQMVAVLSSGHNENLIGKAISRWCLFLNLGTLLLDINSKLRFPISKLLLAKNAVSNAEITKEKAKQIETTGQVMMFASAAYMVLYRRVFANKLNASAVSAAIIFKGLRSLVETFWDKSDDDQTIWSTGGGFLEGYTGGVLMIAMTVVGMSCRVSEEQGFFEAPKWIVDKFKTIEETIDKLVLVIDKIV